MMTMLAFPTLSVVFTGISGVIAFALPIVLAVLCCRRSRNALFAVAVGAVCFTLGAIVLESAFHQLVLAFIPGLTENALLYIVYGCLAAGLFEETARLIGLRFLCKRDASPVTGFSYGVGHGGIEAILLVGVTVLNNFIIMLTVNGGSVDSLLTGATEEQSSLVMAQLEQLAALPSTTFLAAGVERIIAISMHIALSVLIWMVVTKRLPMWGYPLSIALHAVSNIPAAMYQTGMIGLWTSELLTAVLVVCIVFLVRGFYRATDPAKTV